MAEQSVLVSARLPLLGTRIDQREALLAGLAAWVSCWGLFEAILMDPGFVGWDTSIVAASLVAQTLMTWKRIEHWFFWIVPVNVSSIFLFAYTESWAFVFLYMVFLVNAMWGLIKWRSEGN